MPLLQIWHSDVKLKKNCIEFSQGEHEYNSPKDWQSKVGSQALRLNSCLITYSLSFAIIIGLSGLLPLSPRFPSKCSRA